MRSDWTVAVVEGRLVDNPRENRSDDGMLVSMYVTLRIIHVTPRGDVKESITNCMCSRSVAAYASRIGLRKNDRVCITGLFETRPTTCYDVNGNEIRVHTPLIKVSRIYKVDFSDDGARSPEYPGSSNARLEDGDD